MSIQYDLEGSLTAADLLLVEADHPGKSIILKATTDRGLAEWILTPVKPPHDVRVAYGDSPILVLEAR